MAAHESEILMQISYWRDFALLKACYRMRFPFLSKVHPPLGSLVGTTKKKRLGLCRRGG